MKERFRIVVFDHLVFYSERVFWNYAIYTRSKPLLRHSRFSEIWFFQLSPSESPGGRHDVAEVIIVVDGGRDSGVVIVPLSLGDLSVVVFISEIRKELEEGLIFSDLTAHDFRVLSNTIAWLQITSGYNTWTIGIKFIESSVNDSLSLCIQSTSKTNKELVKVNGAILIGIKVSEEAVGLILSEVASRLVESNEKFLGINLSVSVIIILFESSIEASDSFGTSSGHLGFNFFDDCNLKQRELIS